MQRRKELTERVPADNWPEQDVGDYRERKHVVEWPKLERRMAIIARMTSDPPAEPVEE